jgi:hypothetical protein
VPLAAVGQGVQVLPQLSTERSSTHVSPHAWKPGSHCQPQRTPSHVAVARSGAGQAVHDVPHPLVLVSAMHAPPQGWKPGSQRTPQRPALHVAVPLTGTGHATPHAPQLCGSVARSTHASTHAVCPAAQPVTHA